MDGKILKDIRLQKLLTQDQLASMAGVSQATIHKWESTSCNPRLKQFESVAVALGMKPSELLCKMGS